MRVAGRCFVFAIALGTVAAGCDRAADRSAAPAGQHTPAPASTAAAEPARKVVQRVTWDEVPALDEAARAALDDGNRALVDRSPVPVLVPADEAWLAKAKVMVKEHWYALSSRHDGLGLALSAKRVAHRYPGLVGGAPRQRVRGQPAVVSSDRRIVTVSWTQYGIAYSADLECDRPDDARCADPSFLMELCEGLAFVGGDRSVRPSAAEESRP